MPEHGPNAVEKGKIIPDTAVAFVGGKVYEGWEEIKITRELNALASDFSLQVSDRWFYGQEEWKIQPGQKIHLHMGRQSLCTGYVDSIAPSFGASAHSITVSGRSLTADLVDCSAEGPSDYGGLNIKEVAEKLCKPFGINVVMIGEPGAAFTTVAVQPGETVFAILDKLARQRKLLMLPSYEGSLIITPVGTGRAHSPLRNPGNILSGSGSHDFSDRFSKYITKGQDLSFLGTAKQSSAPTGAATDLGVGRYRPMVLVAEASVNDGTSEDRASYEAELRAAKSLTAQVMVQGWLQENGKPWEVNQIVNVDCGKLGLRRKMLIQKVEFNKGNAGTTTNISLIREDAYGFKRTVKKEDPLSWLKVLPKVQTETKK